MTQAADAGRAGRQLRIGIVGAGHFGRFHALKVLESAREVLVGIHDPDKQRAGVVAREVGGVPVLSYPDLLACADAIIVAAPAEYHFDLARQALVAGRHVLVLSLIHI